MGYNKINSPFEFHELTKEEQDVLLRWCGQLEKVKAINRNETSYSLKHLFEGSKDGFYVSNGAFKGAMMMCDFYPHDAACDNWQFAVSQRSINKAFEEVHYHFA